MTATRSGTPRCSCCPCSPHDAQGGRRCADLAALDHGPGRGTRAAPSGCKGTAFPWRTIRGQECSAYWPAGTGAFHINADIALAAVRQVHWTGDELFDRTQALPILVVRRGCGVRWATTARTAVPHRRRHRPGRVQRRRRRQHVHQPHGQRNLRYAADTAERWPDRIGEVRGHRRGDRSLAGRGRRDVRALRRGARRASSRTAARPTTTSGTSPPPRPRTVTRCCCTRPTSTSTASRSSSRPTW